jgi:hypothetical protein
MASPRSEYDDHDFQARVQRAAAMSMAERIMAGPELFDYACEIARAGIRQQWPDADEVQVREELERRLRVAQALERSS